MKTLKQFTTEANVSKEGILKMLIKHGNNKDDAKKMVDKEFDYLVKTYPNATNGKLADIIITL